ncbi:D-alanyl-D-alanine carboxypeptidase/D-alanyl-D-alanine-endopeptidase [Endozoicomonas sp. 8E]|uniref:D-alanyl-D-alanine carboxypeptidase/D-alanyl-D-alanine endopeptidase n=1 Tax=Endozoicomonas sp. 8E TaxID=3035692 RepID=UPI002938E99E|nr:D-alanyl-D-alanine carboxypeptidase/D-alanyl-D-alanine-endopeptidase [Endozoicomonas sp. 8E]WOG29163.1 D-alanyl-D-alanine carboxypeptidase/D-alanyl-D-alanine-endopeptidase [Endozoicomonas sp. 8E]
MLRFLSCLLTVFFIFSFHSAQASQQLVKELQKLVGGLPPGSVHSIQVKDPASGQIIFEQGAHHNLVPASVLKVVTATLAYEVLGDKFQYTTQLVTRDRPIRRGIVNGPVALVFSGDPSLRRKHLDELVGQLKKRGIKSIHGDLWLDGAVFTGYDRAGGVSWDDLNICFAAPAAAMILDRNCFYGWLKPGKKEGSTTSIQYDQPDWFLAVDNQVRTRSEKNCRLEVRPSTDQEYRLQGCISPKSSPVRLAFSVNNVERTVKRYMKDQLQKKGVELKGRVIVGRPGMDLPFVLAEHRSEFLPQLLKPVLKNSDNLYSDSILKTVGYETSGKPGSYASGIETAREVLGGRGVGFRTSRLVDGSGLSRYNFISASTLVDVLMFGWSRWGEKSPWLSARDRKEVWFKTGYMSGVSSVAGYVFQPDGKPLVFAVILNGLMPPLPASREQMKAFRKDIRVFRRSFLKALSREGKV